METKSQTTSPCSERGSVIFYILIAIILFAALSYTVAQMMRSGDPSVISRESAKTYASEILTYSNTLRRAVRAMEIDGYDDTDISFENNSVSGYTNANCTDNDCEVFSPTGGAIRWTGPNEQATDGTDWRFISDYAVSDVGGADSELLAVLKGVNKLVCIQINEMKDITNPSNNPPVADAFSAITKFTGSYDDSSGNIIGDNGDEVNFAGQRAACFEGPVAGTYYFYQVLIAR